MTTKKSKAIKVKAKKDGKKTSKNTSEDTQLQARHFPFDNTVFLPFQTLRREVDDIFNQFTNRFDFFTHAEREGLKIPAMNVDETETSYEISAELPGVEEKDIDISLTDATLTICGTKQHSSKTEDADRRISEFSSGSYERSLTLPFAAKAKDITAEYNNGVLHLTIPKPQVTESKKQKIAIKSAA